MQLTFDPQVEIFLTDFVAFEQNAPADAERSNGRGRPRTCRTGPVGGSGCCSTPAGWCRATRRSSAAATQRSSSSTFTRRRWPAAGSFRASTHETSGSSRRRSSPSAAAEVGDTDPARRDDALDSRGAEGLNHQHMTARACRSTSTRTQAVGPTASSTRSQAPSQARSATGSSSPASEVRGPSRLPATETGRRRGPWSAFPWRRRDRHRNPVGVPRQDPASLPG